MTTLTARTVSIIFLFVGAVAASGLALALTLAAGERANVPLQSWVVPVVMFVCFVFVFFLGRTAVLPPHVAASPQASLGMLSAWMAATIGAAWLINWAVRPLLGPFGYDYSGVVILFVCLLASIAMLDRFTRGRRRIVH
jgi:hypothetical protein